MLQQHSTGYTLHCRNKGQGMRAAQRCALSGVHNTHVGEHKRTCGTMKTPQSRAALAAASTATSTTAARKRSPSAAVPAVFSPPAGSAAGTKTCGVNTHIRCDYRLPGPLPPLGIGARLRLPPPQSSQRSSHLSPPPMQRHVEMNSSFGMPNHPA